MSFLDKKLKKICFQVFKHLIKIFFYKFACLSVEKVVSCQILSHFEVNDAASGGANRLMVTTQNNQIL